MKKYTSTHHLYIKIFIKKIECFSNYIQIHIIANILIEEELNSVIDDICNDKYFEKPYTEIKNHDSIEELKYLQE